MSLQKKVISFVVLYYKAYSDTLECVDALLKLKQDNCAVEIVLVDNFSNDNSFGKIEDLYRSFDNIHFVRTEKNLGYAKGNNVGISYAKKTLHTDYVVILNTDAIIKDDNFCNSIMDVFSKEQYYVMGPKVLSYYDTSINQSPRKMEDDRRPVYQLVNEIVHLAAWKLNIVQFIRKVRPKPILNQKQPRGEGIYKCVCHGCCLVFSPLFLKRWDLGFDAGTFLYREEIILFYILHKLNCKTLYYRDLEVFHKGGTSMNIISNNIERNKMLNVFKIRIRSIIEEIRVMRMNDEELSKVLSE